MPKKATKKAERDQSPDKKRNATDKVRETLYMSADYIMNLRRVIIPFSPAFDSVLGGGIVSGSMTTLASSPKCGKTSSCLHLCTTCQRPEYGGRYWDKDAVKDTGNKPGRPVFFYSTENRLTKRDLSLPGLDLSEDKFKLIVTTDKKTLYLEQFFENIEQTIDMYPGCVILVDSIGSLCSEKVAEATEGGQVRDPAPLLSSFFMKRIGQLLMAKDIIMLNVLHKVTNTGAKPGQATKQTTGGEKIKYGANNIIEITWSEISRDDEDCMILHLLGKTSELGPPDEKADGCLRLGRSLWGSSR